MTTLDATVPAAQPAPAMPPPRPPGGLVRFLGPEGAYWRLMIRGSVFLAITLGIYRFWLTTDQRRFLWSNTEVLGETLEYTGTARELLIGFLIAIAILLPLYGLIFLMALDLGLVGKLAGVIGFVLLSLFGQYAVFRARRYRLTRTIYRGVRFHQTGSAWQYAIYASLWWIAVLLSLGLLYPLMEAQLDRFRMRNTWLGNLQGRFEGSAFRLFLRGFFMWLITIGPLVGSLIAVAVLIDAKLILELPLSITNQAAVQAFTQSHPALMAALGFAGGALIWALVIAPFLYPVFQAMVLRWWASGLRFGNVTLTSKLRGGQVYGTYLRFIGWSMLFGMIAGIMFGMVITLVVGFAKMIAGSEEHAQVAIAVAGVIGYIAFALGYSVIYQVKVRLGLWRIVAESIDVSNTAELEHVSSVGAPASAVGEGLADALNVGGF
jgi:uncharacterized membrane protein YjgN (DUF898 family)